MSASWLSQSGHGVRLEWGRRGAALAAARGDALVVVDVLSFSTATAIATARGAGVVPCDGSDAPEALARELGAEAAVRRDAVPAEGRFSLSPPSMEAAAEGDLIVLASPNGATCSRLGSAVPALFVGGLVNATAVGEAAGAWLAEDGSRGVSVLACGERHADDHEDGPLRAAVEDLLGAGAILDALAGGLAHAASLSPEARVARAAFAGLRGDLADVLRDCGSGRELRERGWPEDVESALRLDALRCVPRLDGDVLVDVRR